MENALPEIFSTPIVKGNWHGDCALVNPKHTMAMARSKQPKPDKRRKWKDVPKPTSKSTEHHKQVHNENPNHDEKGRFSKMMGDIKEHPVHTPLIVEHAVADAVKQSFAKLKERYGNPDKLNLPPSKTMKTLTIAGKGGKFAVKVAYAPWIAGQKAVEAVAKEKGLSDKEAKVVRSVVTCYDALNCKAIAYGLHSMGMHGTAAASVFLPTASLSYLGHATLTDFPAVSRAAGKAIASAAGKSVDAVDKGISKFDSALDRYAPRVAKTPAFNSASNSQTMKQAVGVLTDAVKSHKGSDWYGALLAQAIERSGNIQDAVMLADKAFSENPKPC